MVHNYSFGNCCSFLEHIWERIYTKRPIGYRFQNIFKGSAIKKIIEDYIFFTGQYNETTVYLNNNFNTRY